MNIKSFYTFIFIQLSILSLCACSDDMQADIFGERENAVYIINGDRSYTIVHLPEYSVSSLNYKLELHCSHKTAADFTATLKIDNSLIAQYNEEHGTNYAELPSNVLNIENETVRFEKGKFVSSDTLHITASGSLQACNNEDGYLLPISIESVCGEGVKVADTHETAYVVLQVQTDDDNICNTSTEPFGETVKDRSGWNAIVPEGTTYSTLSEISKEPNDMFNAEKDYSTFTNIQYWQGRSLMQESLPVIIDLGKTYTFDGLYADFNKTGFYAVSSWTNGSLIEVSEDMENWQEVGHLSHKEITQAFHTSVTARYIRITVVNNGGYYVYFRCGNFNIYELKK